MKIVLKVIIALLALLALIALFTNLIPISRGKEHVDSLKVTICHWDNGHGGKYTSNDINVNSVDKCTNAAGHDSHDKDIIPSYTFGDCTYDGKNTDKESWIANDCSAPQDPTATPTSTPTLTPTATPTNTPTPTPTDEPNCDGDCVTPTPTETVTPTPTEAPRETPTPTPTVQVSALSEVSKPSAPASCTPKSFTIIPTIWGFSRVSPTEVKFNWTPGDSGENRYVVFYGYSENNLQYNARFEGLEADIKDLTPNVSVWARVAQTDDCGIGPISVAVDP